MEDNHNPRNASDQKPGAKNGIHASFAPLKGVLLISDFCPSGLSEKISVFLATKFVVICNNSLRKLILFISLQISGRSRPRYTNPNLISCHSPVSFITLQLIGCLCSYNTPQFPLAILPAQNALSQIFLYNLSHTSGPSLNLVISQVRMPLSI